MSRWILIKQENRELWNDILSYLKCNNLYQSFEWGVVQSAKGWVPYNFVLHSDDGDALLAVQILSKKRFGLTIIWIPGGVAGNIKYLDEDFRSTIKYHLKTYFLYIRCNMQVQVENKSIGVMLDNGWTKPLKKITSEKSILVNVAADQETRLHSASKNWRHNLRRAQKRSSKVKRVWRPNINELLNLYTEMESQKNLPPQFAKSQLKIMFEVMGDNLIYYECRDNNNNLIAIRAIAVTNNMGLDLLAASNYVARKQYSTYAIIWELFNELKSRGVKVFDFGGVDPENNPGVYNFKKGVGGVEVDYLGEYEWASNRLFKHLISYVLSRR